MDEMEPARRASHVLLDCVTSVEIGGDEEANGGTMARLLAEVTDEPAVLAIGAVTVAGILVAALMDQTGTDRDTIVANTREKLDRWLADPKQ